MPSKRYAKYLEQSRQHHVQRKTFSGNGCLKHLKTLVEISLKVDATSALDFGAGKRAQYQPGGKFATAAAQFGFEIEPGETLEMLLGYEVTKYDPAVPEIASKPEGQFDLVWCSDVLEHIPEEDIGWVIHELDGYARRALFVTVGSYPAKKTLPNGENAHVTIKPVEWWREQFAANLSERADGFVFELLAD